MTRALLAIGPILVGCFALGACTHVEPPTQSLDGVRRGRVYVHTEGNGRLDIEIQPAQGPDDYAYLQGTDGRTLERRRLDRRSRQTLTRALGEGAGTYTIVPSPSHRMRVSAHDATLSFAPEAEFPSLYFSGTKRFVFDVPDSARSFTLAVTNQHDWEGTAASITLHRPDGWQAHRFDLEALDKAAVLRRLGIDEERQRHYEAQGDTAIVPEFRLLIDRHTIESPTPGTWEVRATVEGLRADDIGFWLEGVSNVFAPPGGSPRMPDGGPVEARIRVDPGTVRGDTGAVGAVWGWTVHEAEALEAYRTMGLSGSKNFYPQVDMEGRVRNGTFSAENDDRDPDHIDWDGFLFGRFRHRLDVYAEQRIPMRTIAVISRIAPWALSRPDEIAEYAEACVTYYQIQAPVDPSGIYWQFLNEPNHEVSAREYVDAFRRVGARLHARLEARGVDVRFGGPATGNAWSDTEAVPWEWIEGLIREADDVLDFVVWNQYRLGRIEDAWRYAAHVARADSLISALDSDGVREEILIGATNLRGGIVLQRSRQDGPYSAVWWPAVMCHALGTGRVGMLNYFWLIDHGSRRKGLLRSDWSMKPVALATAFASDYREVEVVDAASDHDGVAVLATRKGEDDFVLLAVNTLERPVSLTVETSTREGWNARAERFDASSLARDQIPVHRNGDGAVVLKVPGWSLVGLEWTREAK